MRAVNLEALEPIQFYWCTRVFVFVCSHVNVGLRVLCVCVRACERACVRACACVRVRMCALTLCVRACALNIMFPEAKHNEQGVTLKGRRYSRHFILFGSGNFASTVVYSTKKPDVKSITDDRPTLIPSGATVMSTS